MNWKTDRSTGANFNYGLLLVSSSAIDFFIHPAALLKASVTPPNSLERLELLGKTVKRIKQNINIKTKQYGPAPVVVGNVTAFGSIAGFKSRC